MDLRQIENMIAIEREQSISKAAEKLFMTQSALNQQLLKLEKELGVTLFERRNRQMLPTFAGRVYLSTAHQLISLKNEAYKIIHDIAEEHVGEISLAYTPEQGSLMFSNIYPEFHKQYPGITFRIHEARVKKMEQLLLQHETTLACIAYSAENKNSNFEYHDFGTEYLLLAVPPEHPLAAYAGNGSWTKLPSISPEMLRNEAFVLPTHHSLSREMTDRTFLYHNIVPKILFEAESTQTLINMVRNRQSLTFLPQSYALKNPDLVFFSLPPHELWHRSIAYLKGTYLSQPEKYLIELIQNYSQHP